MNRRNVLVGAGGIGATIIGGAALSGAGAAAQSESNYDIGELSLSSDTGEIDYVAIYGDSAMEWKGLDETATHVQIESSVEVYEESQGDGEPLASTDLNDTGLIALSEGEEWGNHDDVLSGEGTRGYVEHGVGVDESGEHDPSIEWVIIGEKPEGETGADYGLPGDSVNADNLTVGGDGESQNFYAVMTTEYTIYGGGEDNELLSTDTSGEVMITVQNIPEGTESYEGDTGGASGGVSNDGETYEE